MRKADNLPPSCAVVTKSGNLNFLEPSGPFQACNGTALPFYNDSTSPDRDDFELSVFSIVHCPSARLFLSWLCFLFLYFFPSFFLSFCLSKILFRSWFSLLLSLCASCLCLFCFLSFFYCVIPSSFFPSFFFSFPFYVLTFSFPPCDLCLYLLPFPFLFHFLSFFTLTRYEDFCNLTSSHVNRKSRTFAYRYYNVGAT